MIDITTVAYLRSVCIGEDEFNITMEAADLNGVEGVPFTIRGEYGDLIYPDPIWDKIPNDSVWLEESFSWDDPEYTHCCLRRKVGTLYQFKRRNDQLIRELDEPSETEWRQLWFDFHQHELPF